MCAQSALSDLLYRSSLSKHSVILVQICLNCKGFFHCSGVKASLGLSLKGKQKPL